MSEEKVNYGIGLHEEVRPNKFEGCLWQLLELPFYGDIALGNGTAYRIYLSELSNARLFVGIESRGCYTFSRFVHYSYAMEKLNLFESDARNFADFINTQLKVFDQKSVQGNYRPPDTKAAEIIHE